MRNYLMLVGFGLICLMSCGDVAEATSASTKAVTNTATAKAVSKAVATAVSGAINVRISSKSAKKGEEACVSFVVNDFKGVMGYQHSINFNPKELKYKNSRNYGLANLNESNFGITKAAQGSINFLWFDMNVKGVSLADRSNLFDLCFEVLAPSGSKCEVAISDTPLKMEVVGPQKNKLNLNSTPGFINVQ